jgi:acylphosphatase
MTAVRVLISGRVQGVGFRWAAARKAESLGVHGSVRNLSDGRVEALIEGDEAPVEQMIDWLRMGPAAARVDDLSLQSMPVTGVDGFHITE